MTHAQLVERLIMCKGRHYERALRIASREALVEARDRAQGLADTTRRHQSISYALDRLDRTGKAART